MLILAFDTTSEYGGVALCRDGVCLAIEVNRGAASAYSVALFQMVDCVLTRAGVELCDVELFAVANGPGSFTGIRTGLAAAKGWADALHRPAKGVSIFEAMVEEARAETEWAVSILDARRGEFFLRLFRRRPCEVSSQTAGQGKDQASSRAPAWASFDASGEALLLKPDEVLAFLEELVAVNLPGGETTCIVREQDTAARSLREILSQPWGSLRWQAVPATLLEALARLGFEAHEHGGSTSTADLDALYVRRADAEPCFPQRRLHTSGLEKAGPRL